MTSPDQRLADYARLAVRVGANVQPGQLVAVNGLVEHAPLVRAVAREAYAAGARYVDAQYRDEHVRRAMIEAAPDETLLWSPPWSVARARALGEEGAAIVSITGNPEPELFAGLDESRVGRAWPRELAQETLKLSNGLANWTIVSYPTEGWARTVFGEPDLERLWQAVATCVRLDEPDPVAAWQQHIGTLEARAQAMDDRRFDALRVRGPGTDLTIGLFPQTRWR
ncbi:MAG TPA: aminopeptidase, partial [Gaiellaceae bacterium]|nr:aminopeptidase [Gaiellaceae bacterium]